MVQRCLLCKVASNRGQELKPLRTDSKWDPFRHSSLRRALQTRKRSVQMTLRSSSSQGQQGCGRKAGHSTDSSPMPRRDERLDMSL
ncbi:hypothetical protein TNCV_4719691 [Trichonephila clavipes]|uniref:Uncharacterized protein n=1 Tax=Trichonephila clavipes TaxID=2585209 RepID=A0A8X6W6N8_TRICX|nr:hypothetical protein TNCV_4719691 [Trichonephila clavipes]